MLKLAVLMALVAVCVAQEPPKKPVIPETFVAKITVHRRERGEEHMAEGTWERDMEAMMAEESAKFMVRNGTDEEKRIELYDKHMAYSIFMNSTGTYCRERDIPMDEKMPMVWDWVNSDKAHGMKREDPRTHKMVDMWSIHTAGEEVVLLVDDMNPNVPIAVIRRDRRGEEDVRFDSFQPMKPPPGDFMIPAACNKK